MANQIVITNVSQTIAPTPNALQRQGAFISQGATNTTPGALTLLTSAAGLTSILNGALALTSLSWLSGVATATAAAPHGFTVGDTLPVTIAGALPAPYNGTFLATVTGASTFTYVLTANPGSTPAAPAGTYTEADVAELVAMNTTFWAQGSQQAVWVLELGPGNAADGVAELTAWITANPGKFYSYLVPRSWAYSAAYLTMVAQFTAATAKTYFFTTMTLNNYQSFTSLMKSVFGVIEAPVTGAYPANVITAATYANGLVTFTTTTAHNVAIGDWFQISGMSPAGYNGWFKATLGTTGSTLVGLAPSALGSETVLGTLVANTYASAGIPATEFTAAAVFWVTLSYAPSTTNKVTPLSFAFLFGVTPFPTQGNSSLLTALRAANVNYVGTGSEGGISTAILLWGTNEDGNPFNYWYSADWIQITNDQNVSNAIINGSNDPINPLYYNQPGIDRLQKVSASTVNSGVSFGLVLFQAVQTALDGPALIDALDSGQFDGYTVVNAVPFVNYTAENPSDYSQGLYSGLSISRYVPNRGFITIVFNINISNFAS